MSRPMIHWFGWPSSWDHPDFAEWDDNCADTLDAIEEVRRTGALGLDASAWRRDLLDLSMPYRPSLQQELAWEADRDRVFPDLRNRQTVADRERQWQEEKLQLARDRARRQLKLPDYCSPRAWRPGRKWGDWHLGQIRWSYGTGRAAFSFFPPIHDQWATRRQSLAHWRQSYSGVIPSRLARHFLMYSRA